MIERDVIREQRYYQGPTNVLAVRIEGRVEGVIVNPNIVRIVMNIGIYGRSLILVLKMAVCTVTCQHIIADR